MAFLRYFIVWIRVTSRSLPRYLEKKRDLAADFEAFVQVLATDNIGAALPDARLMLAPRLRPPLVTGPGAFTSVGS
jgi:hypothetical protein